MRGKTMKWTNEYRMIAWRCVFNEFGPYRTWGATKPKDRTKWIKTLRRAAVCLSVLSGKDCTWRAVEAQIQWGKGDQSSFKHHGQIANYIHNASAALYSGVITSEDLPDWFLSPILSKPILVCMEKVSKLLKGKS